MTTSELKKGEEITLKFGLEEVEDLGVERYSAAHKIGPMEITVLSTEDYVYVGFAVAPHSMHVRHYWKDNPPKVLFSLVNDEYDIEVRIVEDVTQTSEYELNIIRS